MYSFGLLLLLFRKKKIIIPISTSGCQAGSGLVGDDDTVGAGAAVCAHVESSYIINLRDLDMKHIKDFIFLHGEYYP